MPLWPELDEPSWGLLSGLHRLLLRYAGIMPDDQLSYLRRLHGTGELVKVAESMPTAIVDAGGTLTKAEVQLFADALAAFGWEWDPDLLPDSAATPGAAATPPAFRFYPVTPTMVAQAEQEGVELPRQLDLTRPPPAGQSHVAQRLAGRAGAKLQALASVYDGATKLWMTWRLGGGPRHPDRRIFLAEVGPRVPAWDLAKQMMDDMGQEEAPQAEVLWAGEPLLPYHAQALAGAALLWESSRAGGGA